MQTYREVVWTEGTMLAQQHFQQWDAQHNFLRQRLWRLSHTFNWGIIALDIDEEALLNNTFRLRECELIFPSGDYVQHSAKLDGELSCCLQGLDSPCVSIYLAWHSSSRQAGINGYPEAMEPGAWQTEYRQLPDRNNPENRREVLVAKPHLCLLTEADEKMGRVSIKLAEIVTHSHNGFSLVKEYIPPVFSLYQSAQLQCILMRFLELSKAKQRALAEALNALRQREALTQLVSYVGGLAQCAHLSITLSHYLHVPTQHPESIYLALCQAVASLMTFCQKKRLGSLPDYAHNNLRECFSQLLATYQEVLDEITPKLRNALVLERTHKNFYQVLDIAPEYFDDSAFILAVKLHESNTRWAERFASQVKVASASVIHTIISSALPGLFIKYLSRPPIQLPNKTGYEYFLIETQGDYWQQVKETRSLSLFVSSEFNNAEIELLTLAK